MKHIFFDNFSLKDFFVLDFVVLNSKRTCFYLDIETYGNKATERQNLDSWSNSIYLPEPHKAINTTESVASFQFYARRTGTIYLQIWRKTTTSRIYQLVGSVKVSYKVF